MQHDRPTRSFLLLPTIIVATLGCTTAPPPPAPQLTVGSKSFAESVILGEAVTQLAQHAGADATFHARVGGTRATWEALVNGDIDVYVEYTGTLTRELLTDRDVTDEASMAAALAEHGLAISRPLGFNNTYAMGMREEIADARGIRTISDLRDHPDLIVRVSNDFLNSPDGWMGLKERYTLPFDEVTGVPHNEVYEPLNRDEIHLTDLYSTDAQIQHYGLRTLEDDLDHFPAYEAVLIYRQELEESAPDILAAIRQIEGRITADEMIALNARVALEQDDPIEPATVLVDRLQGR